MTTLSVFERLILLSLLPKEGNFLTLKIVRQMRENLSFSEEEHRELELTQEADGVRWNTEADLPKEIEIGEKATDIVVGVLKKLDDENKLTEQHFSLYEKFIESQSR